MLAGVVLGNYCPECGLELKPFGTGFIKLIRMVIAPIIFCTVVVGIAGMGNLKRVGRIGLKAVLYFEVMTTLALVIGWTVGHAIKPGQGMNIDVTTLKAAELQSTLAQAPAHAGFTVNANGQPSEWIAQVFRGVLDFFLNIIPDTIVGAFAKGDILSVLFISVLFGISLAGVGETNRPVILFLELISKAFMRMIGTIIKLAPIAVFGAISFTISKYGIKTLGPLTKLLLCVFGSCLFFVLVVLGLLLRWNGLSIWKFLRYIREELFIVFGTASSEPVLPRMITKMEALGCSKPLVGLVLPAGYSFNLDGSSIFLTMGALFIAQATNTHLTLGQELMVLFISLLTSKGAATVVGSAFITLTATLASLKTIPVEGMLLILGVDWFLAIARSMTNLVGTGVATIVIARWENEFDLKTAQKVLDSGITDVPETRAEKKMEPLPDAGD